MATEIYIIFDGPPSHESGRFVEVEDGEGHGLGLEQTGADWKQRKKFWTLGPFANANESWDNGYEDGKRDGAVSLLTALKAARVDLRDYDAAPIQQVRDNITRAIKKAEASNSR